MKLESRHKLRSAKKPNGPLRTHREIADILGVHPSVLNHIMGTAKVRPPEPFNQHHSNATRNSYYELNAMLAWWRAYQALKAAP